MPLAGLDGAFTFETFIERLKLHHKETNEEIRILAYIAELRPEELFDSMKRFGFDMKSHGSIIELSIGDVSTKTKEGISLNSDTPSYAIYYCYYEYTKNLLLCFTSEPLEETDKTLGSFVEQRNGITALWLNPLAFDKIRRQIVSQNENSIISEFHASRFRFNLPEVIRGDFDRYFRYTGDDGKYALDELSRAYGVLPTSIKFIIPNVAKFWLTNKGKFTFIHGSIDFLFDIINEILSIALRDKSIIDGAKIEFIPVDMGKKEVKLPRVVPLEIIFSKEIDFTEVEGLIENMKGEDFNFDIYDMLLIPGSIHLSGTVIDRNKNGAFNLTANLNKVTISPRRDTNFDSMFQFYKMIVERLDPNAKLEVFNTLPNIA